MEGPTLLMTTFQVRADAVKAFAAWQEKMNSAVASFPGFASLEMLPQNSKEHPVWLSVHRFHSPDDLEAWCSSKQWRQMLDEATPLLLNTPELTRVGEGPASNHKGSVTEVFVTHVTPGNYSLYRKWASRIQQIEAQFPGYQGVYIQSPGADQDGNWITILRFDTPEHLDAWLTSNERKEILKECESMVDTLQSHRVASPFAGWFANISSATGKAPPVWKQTMLVLLVLFPIVMLELRFLSPLTQSFNSAIATFIGNAISVTLISWPVMPLAIRALGWWLEPRGENFFRTTIKGALVVIALYAIEIACLWHLLDAPKR